MSDAEFAIAILALVSAALSAWCLIELQLLVRRLDGLSSFLSKATKLTSSQCQQGPGTAPSPVQPLVVVLEAKEVRQWLRGQGSQKAAPASKRAPDQSTSPTCADPSGASSAQADVSFPQGDSAPETGSPSERLSQARQEAALRWTGQTKPLCDGPAAVPAADFLPHAASPDGSVERSKGGDQ